MDAYDAIMTRRMVPRPQAGAAPTRDEIHKLLDAAVRAPTHFITEPWRFVVLTGDALEELGEAWARGEDREGRDPDKVRERPLRAPVILTVIERPHLDHPKVVEVEEHHATGAAMQNILLAAHATGLAAMIRTGAAAQLQEVRDYLGCEEGELIAGFIYLGYPPEGDDERPMTRRTPAAEKTEWRGFD
jgi:nitroreductase